MEKIDCLQVIKCNFNCLIKFRPFYVFLVLLLTSLDANSTGYKTPLTECYSTPYAACAAERYDLPPEYILAKMGGPSIPGTCCHRYSLHQGGNCNGNYRVSPIKACTLQFMCPSPYLLAYTEDGPICEARCSKSHMWDDSIKGCVPKPVEQSCKTQTDHPIDIVWGSKFRVESVIIAGSINRIELKYFYNNQYTMDKLANGIRNSAYDPRQPPDAVVAPISIEAYDESYTKYGLPKTGYFTRNDQFLSRTNRYWRHNYDDVLIDRSTTAGFYVYSRHDGIDIQFDSLGVSKIYPNIVVEVLSSSEVQSIGFSGHKITDRSSGIRKYFDLRGRLVRVAFNDGQYHSVLYNPNDTIYRIVNSADEFLEFQYLESLTRSNYSIDPDFEYYPDLVSDHTGRKVSLFWNATLYGQMAEQKLINRISHVYTENDPVGAREFEYKQVGTPGSITAIYDVYNLALNERKLYAAFKYDLDGTALTSELGGGLEKTNVNYVSESQRIVTNALGKNTTYTFEQYDDITRLKSVVGEATGNCVESNTAYNYYPNGNLESKIRNGVTTHFEYNARNKEIVQTKAQNTGIEQMRKTCWHPVLDKPERIIEPNRVSIFEYFENGQIKEKRVEAADANNVVCN